MEKTNMIPDLSSVRIKTRHISKNIYMLEATEDVAGNIGASIGPDGVLLVDTQFAPLSKQIIEALRTIGGKKIQYIVNTHSHEDHDQWIFLIGGDGKNFVEFDADCEMLLGDEVRKIDYSCYFYIPAGTPHCPLVVKRVGKPIIFIDARA